ncbi:unnamed protein product [Linum trigynum]|uniref:Uncharacterized protein n=1 Tax=Linum trigynum TaxID=586398 RepID=A0AAV2CDV4_9ROSI
MGQRVALLSPVLAAVAPFLLGINGALFQGEKEGSAPFLFWPLRVHFFFSLQRNPRDYISSSPCSETSSSSRHLQGSLAARSQLRSPAEEQVAFHGSVSSPFSSASARPLLAPLLATLLYPTASSPLSQISAVAWQMAITTHQRTDYREEK